jgi:hypothetical protein
MYLKSKWIISQVFFFGEGHHRTWVSSVVFVNKIRKFVMMVH